MSCTVPCRKNMNQSFVFFGFADDMLYSVIFTECADFMIEFYFESIFITILCAFCWTCFVRGLEKSEKSKIRISLVFR